MTGPQKVRLNSLIQKLVAAEIAASWAGSEQDIDEREAIRERAVSAKKRLTSYIDSLTDKSPDAP